MFDILSVEMKIQYKKFETFDYKICRIQYENILPGSANVFHSENDFGSFPVGSRRLA
jgi:hypothetical protein